MRVGVGFVCVGVGGCFCGWLSWVLVYCLLFWYLIAEFVALFELLRSFYRLGVRLAVDLVWLVLLLFGWGWFTWCLFVVSYLVLVLL